MNEWTSEIEGAADEPCLPERTVSGNLWTRRNALALTAGFLTLGASSARASTYAQTPQPRATSIVISKSKRVLALMSGQDTLKRYRVNLGFAPEGHKLRSGDGRTPEGQYFIDRRNPRSDFFLSLGISYPNAADIARSRALGVQPGGDIFIHGGPNRQSRKGRDWTAGCIAVTDPEMEEIWSMVPTGVPVFILT